MATVNYSIPDEVKELFNMAFTGRNRSAVVSELMRQAAEHELRLRRRQEAIDAVLEERSHLTPVVRQAVEDALREVRR
jgi:hypothetical protein